MPPDRLAAEASRTVRLLELCGFPDVEGLPVPVTEPDWWPALRALSRVTSWDTPPADGSPRALGLLAVATGRPVPGAGRPVGARTSAVVADWVGMCGALRDGTPAVLSGAGPGPAWGWVGVGPLDPGCPPTSPWLVVACPLAAPRLAVPADGDDPATLYRTLGLGDADRTRPGAGVRPPVPDGPPGGPVVLSLKRLWVPAAVMCPAVAHRLVGSARTPGAPVCGPGVLRWAQAVVTAASGRAVPGWLLEALWEDRAATSRWFRSLVAGVVAFGPSPRGAAGMARRYLGLVQAGEVAVPPWVAAALWRTWVADPARGTLGTLVVVNRALEAVLVASGCPIPLR